MLWSTTVVTPKIKQLKNILVFQWVTSGNPGDMVHPEGFEPQVCVRLCVHS
jgi:hypothetical protein